MKLCVYKFSIVLGLVLFLGVANADSLKKANEAYLQKDFKTMTSEIKNTLIEKSNDPLVKKSAMDLLMKAYEVAGSDGISTDWKLPEEIEQLKITVRFVDGRYKLRVVGDAPVGTIEKLKVTRVYPEQVVIDSKVDPFEEIPATSSDSAQFKIVTKSDREKIPSGLYTLMIKTKKGKQVDGYFIIDDDMSSIDIPEVLIPSDEQILNIKTPTFKWKNFKSSKYKPYEKRSLYVGIYGAEEPNPDFWEVNQSSPTIEETTVGVTSNQYETGGISKLENGNYVVNVTYREKKKFGDLILGRESGVTRSFSVQVPLK